MVASAFRDDETGLYTREYVDDALAREFARAERRQREVTLVLVSCDIANLSEVSAAQSLTKIYQSMGEFLANNIRRTDIVGRYEVNQFLVIMAEASLTTAKARCEQLRVQMKVGEERLSRAIPVTASFGLAAYPSQGDNPAAVISAASEALAQAHGNGGDQVVAAAIVENVFQ